MTKIIYTTSYLCYDFHNKNLILSRTTLEVPMHSNNLSSTYKLVSNYKGNELLRKLYNELTRTTYGFDFEAWYQDGYWRDKHIPYSLIYEDKMIANVSVNLMEFLTPYGEKKYLQLGTVMTDMNFRKKGLSRFLLEQILLEWKHKTDGIYLFANDSVLDFYPKFGFKKCVEYQYSKQLNGFPSFSAKNINMSDPENKKLLFHAILNSKPMSKLTMLRNPELIMFYVTSFMKDTVFYIEDLNTYAIIEKSNHTLTLYDIFSSKNHPIDAIINALSDNSIDKVVLNFTPTNTDGFTESILMEDNTTLYVLGDNFDFINKDKLMFPSLSHT